MAKQCTQHVFFFTFNLFHHFLQKIILVSCYNNLYFLFSLAMELTTKYQKNQLFTQLKIELANN
jgi:hypothetical protein